MNLLILQDTDVTCLHVGEKNQIESSLFLCPAHTILCLTIMDANLFTARLNSLFCQSCRSVYVQSCIWWSHMLNPRAVICKMLLPPPPALSAQWFIGLKIFCHSEIYFHSFCNKELKSWDRSIKSFSLVVHALKKIN